MKMRLENVRLSFPNLFEPYDGGKYGAKLILPPDHPQVTAIKKAMVAVAKDAFGDKAPVVYKQLEATDKLALHDGDTKAEYAGFEGNLFVSANNKMRPTVIDGDKSPLTAADGKPYSGCFVNAVVEFWAQNHAKHGKRINASLLGVQFYKDGEPLGSGTVASEDDFESLPGFDADTESGEMADESLFD